jgi:hypothetical protein
VLFRETTRCWTAVRLCAIGITELLEVARYRSHVNCCGSALRYRRPIWAFPPQTWATCHRKRPFFFSRGRVRSPCLFPPFSATARTNASGIAIYSDAADIALRFHGFWRRDG